MMRWPGNPCEGHGGLVKVWGAEFHLDDDVSGIVYTDSVASVTSIEAAGGQKFACRALRIEGQVEMELVPPARLGLFHVRARDLKSCGFLVDAGLLHSGFVPSIAPQLGPAPDGKHLSSWHFVSP